MKIFLDTADVSIIKKWSTTGIIDGVTTNPTHLSKEKGDPKQLILDICKLLPNGSISVEVTETEPQAVYKQAHAIARISPQIVVKIPCHIDYYPIIYKLVQENISLNITLVFSLAQALYMAKLGVAYISPFIGRLDDSGANGIELIYAIAHMLTMNDYKSELLAASIRNVDHLNESILAGAHIITTPPNLLEKSTHHDLTDAGMKKFIEDWKTRNISQFP